MLASPADDGRLELQFARLDLDLSVERCRIPIILVFDDLFIDDPHETAPLDPKCPSRRGHANGLAEKGAGHDPFAGRGVSSHRAISDFYSEVREGDERPFEEGLDRLASAKQAISQYSAFSAKRLRNNEVSCVLQALAHLLTTVSGATPDWLIQLPLSMRSTRCRRRLSAAQHAAHRADAINRLLFCIICQ